MAGRAGQGFSIQAHGVAQVKRVIEPEGVWILEPGSSNAKIRVAQPEAVEEIGAATRRTRGVEGDDTRRQGRLKLSGRDVPTANRRSGHHRGISVAMRALDVGR